MRLLYVPLSAELLARLCQIAERERREPREQAAYLLERALEPLQSSGPTRTDEGTSGAGSEQAGEFSRPPAQPAGARQGPGGATEEHCPALRLTEEGARREPGT